MKKILIATVLFLMTLSVPALAGTYRRSYSSDKCIAIGCNGRKYNNSSYCSEHKCVVYDCRNRRGTKDGYCTTHHNQYDKLRNSRNSKSSSSGYRNKSRSGSSFGSRKSGFDPDDHDIEGYYDDYRDEYDDYDDAYDGFMDDEDAWDDY